MTSPHSDSAAPTRRFSDRVENYIRYRPSYPLGVVEALREHAGLGSGAVVADVGSGTGIFAERLLAVGARVIGLEPNDAMRAAAEQLLARKPNFTSLAGTAEATGLPAASVDLVTAAQAFHWFDGPASRREFARILRPGGLVALIWNERLTDATPFHVEYEALLKRHATDYEQVNHANLDETALAAFFAPAAMTVLEFPNAQAFDLAGLQGRLLSSSYAPNAGQPGHEAMMDAVNELHARHQVEGRVAFLYKTKVYLGKMSS